MRLILPAFCVAACLPGLTLASVPETGSGEGAGAARAAAQEAPSGAAGEARTLADAFRMGEVGLSLRYRWEHVGDEAPAVADEEADASTIRTTLSFRTAPLLGFSAFVEFEDVSNLGMSNDHNDTVNGVTDHPVIADPTGTDFEQGYLRYARPEAVEASAGRMHLTLAEERYLGPVGWRQNQQSFDALEVAVKAIPRTTLRLIYIDNVLRVFGDNQQMSSPLVDAEVRIGGSGKLTGYWYLLDYDDAAQAGLSTSTAGARWEHAWKLPGSWSLPWHAEYARQTDAGDNPSEVEADYIRIEAGGKRGSLHLKLGYELLGGDPGDGSFATPLATLHRWNGWADKFLVTPASGLEDIYASAAYGWKGWSGTLVYHNFNSDSGNDDYGSEVDALIEWKSSWRQTFSAKAALYDADDFAADTEKYWIYTSWQM